jgi:myosin-1
MLTSRSVFLVGREVVKKGPEKGKPVEVIKRKLDFENISHVSLSTLQVGSCGGLGFYIRQ